MHINEKALHVVTTLLSALDDLDKAPTLHLGQGAALHNADGIAHASRALLVMSVKLLGAGHHLAILGVTLALRGLDNNGLVARDGDDDTRTDLTRVTRDSLSHALLLPYSAAADFSAAI